MTLTNTNENEPCQSLDIRSRHFERRRRAEINQRRINVFAREELLHHLGGRMPDSPILDVNELPVVRFENIPRVQLSEAVVAHNLPIRSAWQYFAFDSRTGEGTTKDRHNSASAFRDVTYFHRWSDLRTQFEYKYQFRPTNIAHQMFEPILCNLSRATHKSGLPFASRKSSPAYFVADRLENLPCFR